MCHLDIQENAAFPIQKHPTKRTPDAEGCRFAACGDPKQFYMPFHFPFDGVLKKSNS